MPAPVVAQNAPIAVDVEEGRSYWWCACGKSKKQPFCDGSHRGGDFVPLEYKAATTGKVWFCACKSTATVPLCDGTHRKLGTA
jgi:CDGSH iron-sulfur domain-containing protein 3